MSWWVFSLQIKMCGNEPRILKFTSVNLVSISKWCLFWEDQMTRALDYNHCQFFNLMYFYITIVGSFSFPRFCLTKIAHLREIAHFRIMTTLYEFCYVLGCMINCSIRRVRRSDRNGLECHYRKLCLFIMFCSNTFMHSKCMVILVLGQYLL